MRTKRVTLFIFGVQLVLVSLPACGPQLQRPGVSQELIQQERAKQEQMALRLRVERRFQLANVLERLRYHGQDWCKSGCPVSTELIDSDKVNAFTDGVKIGMTTGMMRFVRNDDELAFVLSHELAHAALNHIGKQAGNVLLGTLVGAALDLGLAAAGATTGGLGTRLGQDLGKLVFSQEFEMEADYLGLQIAARAGFDISKAADLFRRMGVEHPGSISGNFLSTHPSSPERTAAIEAATKEIQGQVSADAEVSRISPVEDRAAKKEDEPSAVSAKTEAVHKTPQLGAKPETVVKRDQKLQGKKESHTITTAKASDPERVLYVARGGAKLYAKQWDYSKILLELPKGEVLVLLGQAFGTDGVLYNVRTQRGIAGWISASDVSPKPQ